MKKIIHVIPLKQVHGIEFGTKREEVRRLLGLPYEEFLKDSTSKVTTDDFGFCHVFYTKKVIGSDSDNNIECMEAIEIFNDEEDDDEDDEKEEDEDEEKEEDEDEEKEEIEVYIDRENGSSIKIFPIAIEEAEALIKDAVRDDDGLLSKSQSIGIYAPYNKMESILFGVKGYYDEF